MVRTMMATLALTGLTFGSAWACGGDKGVTAKAEIKEVPVEQLASWVDKSEAAVYDANRRSTFEEGHIPGAVHVDYSALDATKLPAEKDALMVFYCKNEMCGASEKAAKVAADMGFKNLFVFKPGIDGWVKAGHKVVKATPAKAPAKTGKAQG